MAENHQESQVLATEEEQSKKTFCQRCNGWALEVSDATILLHHQAVFMFGSEIRNVQVEQEVQARGLIRCDAVTLGNYLLFTTGAIEWSEPFVIEG